MVRNALKLTCQTEGGFSLLGLSPLSSQVRQRKSREKEAPVVTLAREIIRRFASREPERFSELYYIFFLIVQSLRGKLYKEIIF